MGAPPVERGRPGPPRPAAPSPARWRGRDAGAARLRGAQYRGEPAPFPRFGFRKGMCGLEYGNPRPALREPGSSFPPPRRNSPRFVPRVSTPRVPSGGGRRTVQLPLPAPGLPRAALHPPALPAVLPARKFSAMLNFSNILLKYERR